MAREIGNLKNKQVEKLIRRGVPGKHYDGRGLRLEIKGPGSAHWVTRYQFDGVERWMGLGSARVFTLTEARHRNPRWYGRSWPTASIRCRSAAPNAPSRKQPRPKQTFAEACDDFLEQHSAKWDSLKHRAQWERTLKVYAEPVIGALPVAEIDVRLVLKVLEQPVAAGYGYPAGELGMPGGPPAGCAAASRRSWIGPRGASCAAATTRPRGTSSARSCLRAAQKCTTPRWLTKTWLTSWRSSGGVRMSRRRRCSF